MKEIVNRLRENRIDEVKKKVALQNIASELESRLSKVKSYSPHTLSINLNNEESCIDVEFRGTGDTFRVYPQKTKVSNENSNKVIKVSDIDGAYIEGTSVYDSEGKLLGEALIRTRAIHNKSDYSDKLEDAGFRFNSKITDLKRFEKYIASDAINKIK